MFPADGIGKACEIVLKSDQPGSIITDAGRIAQVDGEFVVLRSATRTTLTLRIVPIVGYIPLVGKLFRYYTAVGTEKVPGELRVAAVLRSQASKSPSD